MFTTAYRFARRLLGLRDKPSPAPDATVYEKYSAAMAYVEVKGADGQVGIGSAFHVGEGVFVTARHVVEGKKITEVGTTAGTQIRLEGDAAAKSLITVHRGGEEYKVHEVEPAVLQIAAGPFFHSDPTIDVAVFKVAEIDPRMPAVPLGGHLDDWLGDGDLMLTEVVIMGYPPVPYTTGPHLIAARGQVNAVLDLRHAKHVHFIVSATPRGGFSGGLAATESGYALGVITQSLLNGNVPEQLGFMAVLSVEPIYVCLAEHRLLPACQTETWQDFWNTESVAYYEKGTVRWKGGVMAAQVEWTNDGRKQLFRVLCPDEAARDEAVRTIVSAMAAFGPEVSLEGKSARIELVRPDASHDEVKAAAQAAVAILDKAGYVRMAGPRESIPETE